MLSFGGTGKESTRKIGKLASLIIIRRAKLTRIMASDRI
jgi:hypothetical protein